MKFSRFVSRHLFLSNTFIYYQIMPSDETDILFIQLRCLFLCLNGINSGYRSYFSRVIGIWFYFCMVVVGDFCNVMVGKCRLMCVFPVVLG